MSRVTSRVFKNNRYTAVKHLNWQKRNRAHWPWQNGCCHFSLCADCTPAAFDTHFLQPRWISGLWGETHTLNIPAGDRVKAFFSLYLLLDLPFFCFVCEPKTWSHVTTSFYGPCQSNITELFPFKFSAPRCSLFSCQRISTLKAFLSWYPGCYESTPILKGGLWFYPEVITKWSTVKWPL